MLSRRQLLASCASLALVPDAKAQIGNLFSGARIADNGGKSQVNFQFLQFSGDYRYINLLKGSQQWAFQDNTSAPVTPDLVDANGYPTTIIHSGYSTVFTGPSVTERPGNYIVMAYGEGSGTCGGAFTSSAGTWTRTVVTPNNATNRYVLSILSRGASSYISNLAFFHADDEAAWLAGRIFGTKFLQKMNAARFGRIRDLNNIFANTSNMTTWASRKPVNYWSYYAPELRASIYAGTSSLVGSAFSAALPGFVLQDKATVSVNFTQSNPGDACTLNVNSTGDINVLDPYSGAITPTNPGSFWGPLSGSSKSFGTLVYDATLNSWIKQGSDFNGSMGLNNGEPPEMFIALCRELGAHPHLVAPQFAVDPMTDYISSYAALCNSIAWMKPGFEGPNELWNGAIGYYQTPYAQAKVDAYKISAGWSSGSTTSDWYGKVMSTIGQAVSAVYGDDRTKYRVICSVWTTSASFFGTAFSNQRLATDEYIAQSTPAQSGYTKSPASDWVTDGCLANYFGPTIHRTNDEMVLAWQYNQGDLSAPTTYIDTLTTGTSPSNLPGAAIVQALWKTFFQGFGINRMCCYEGGYSALYLSTAVTSPISAASKASSCVITLANTNMQGVVNSNTSTPAASIGMALTIAGVVGMTELNNPAAYGVTFSNGSANISASNTLLLNQAVYFTTSGALPTNFVANTPYYVVSTGNPFQVSATRGGTAIVAGSAGSGSQFAKEAWFITAVSGTSVTLDVDSTGFTAYGSAGTATYVNAPTLLNTLRYQSKLAPGLQAYTITNYNNFVGLTGGGFTAEYPSCFQFAGATPSDNTWSVLEDLYQTPDPPQYLAFVQFNSS